MSEPYEPIPIPFKQKLREFRHRVVPVLVFLIISVIVFRLWDMRVNEPGFSAKVVADSAMVASPYDGQLENFYIQPFDRVEKGTPIATIVRADSGYYNARLDYVRSLINQVEIGLDPLLNHQRNVLDYENMRVENMQTRIDIASLRIQVQQLKAEYNRAQELLENDNISQSEFDLIESEYQVAKSELEEKIKLTDDLTQRLENIEDQIISDNTEGPISAAIDVYEKELQVVEEELKPIHIYAPISGVVSKVFKGNGEFVARRDQILKIESTEPKYIIGYVRQPFNVEPEPGMKVEVRTRKPDRSYFNSHIVRIGGQISYMDPQLSRPGVDLESGLPVQIAIRNIGDIKLYPGEIVDVVLHPQQ